MHFCSVCTIYQQLHYSDSLLIHFTDPSALLKEKFVLSNVCMLKEVINWLNMALIHTTWRPSHSYNLSSKIPLKYTNEYILS
jgi:hypothetical protein